MSIADSRHHQIFPALSPAQVQVARRFASVPPQRYAPGEVLFAVGARQVSVFLILSGTLDVRRRDGAGREAKIISHGPGEFSGEVSQLAGRATLVEGKAGSEGCEALAYDPAHLRALIVGSAEVGEIIMRAFILRRMALIAEGGAGLVLLGRRAEPRLLRIEGFLSRNGYPYAVLDVDSDTEGRALIEQMGLLEEELPIALCPDGSVLKQPSDAHIAACVGITPEIDPNKVFDVAVVGAGPAGLACAVYAASEGLSALVLDASSFGGQAGASARIENYLGFPTGISGHALAARAFNQAQKFGAEIAIPVAVERLETACGSNGPFVLRLAEALTAKARHVVIASGVRYRRPVIENLAKFEGAGASYWASPIEASLCEGKQVALVGAGNSAGQAIAYLAPKVERLHLFVRGESLDASMSRYLIDRVSALPNVTLYLRTEVTALAGDAVNGLQTVTFRNRDTGESGSLELSYLFLFIGADPNTDWLEGSNVARDENGFVLTADAAGRPCWSQVQRPPLPLETSVPNIFAIGDVRASSTKRVAAAVGEGAQVVAALHTLNAPLKEHQRVA